MENAARSLVFALVLLFAASCVSMNGKRLESGLYEMEFDNSDYSYAMSILRDERGKERDDALKDSIRFDLGFTSSVNRGSMLARSYNDYTNDRASFVIRIPKAPDRFASIGVSPGIEGMDDAFVGSALKYDSYYKVLPFLLVDGINENGVVVTLSSYPISDFSPEMVLDLYRHGNFSPKRRDEMIRNMIRVKENVSFEDRLEQSVALNGADLRSSANGGEDEIFVIMSVRYLLDKASSARDAVEIMRRTRILDYPTVDEKTRGYHYMIADENECFCVEFIDGEMYVNEDATVMTDFSFNNLGSYSMMGEERYDILRSRQREMLNVRDMVNIMKDTYYSKAYDVENRSSFWFSECYTDKGMFTFTPPSLDTIDESFDGRRFLEDYYSNVRSSQGEIRQILSSPKSRSADDNILYSSHVSVYDMKARNLTLIVRENDVEFDFQL